VSQIKAVIWDLAGVVLHTVKGTFNTLLAERLDAPLTEIDRLMLSKENELWDIDEIDDDTYYTFLLKELKMPMEKKAVLRKFVVDDFYIDQDMLTYIKNLRELVTTMLLTNFPSHVHDFFKSDWIVDGAFDHLIASCDIKLIKPDPAIYTLALDRLNLEAEECVFIDDREVNVNAAQKLGINGVVFQSKSQTMHDVDNLLKN
jgi:epoxide hydrolase-like predicted phosphatase